jgi:2-(1,2-epoxy-1,2-dihydrophenyl)acetyl-CoA isomerase
MNAVIADTPTHGVRRLRLNIPERLNALDDHVKSALLTHLAAAADDLEVRAVLITGVGRAFCAGGDVQKMGARVPTETVDVLVHGRRLPELIMGMQTPVVAAVNGAASGAGFNLALACDIVLAHQSAWFQQSFVRLGLIPDLGGSYLLARQVGLNRAKEILLTGRRIESAEAQQLGIVAAVFADDFDKRAVEYAGELAKGPTRALGLTKLLTNRAVESSIQAALDREMLAQGVASSTSDHRAAVEAFKNKHRLETVEFVGE